MKKYKKENLLYCKEGFITQRTILLNINNINKKKPFGVEISSLKEIKKITERVNITEIADIELPYPINKIANFLNKDEDILIDIEEEYLYLIDFLKEKLPARIKIRIKRKYIRNIRDRFFTFTKNSLKELYSNLKNKKNINTISIAYINDLPALRMLNSYTLGVEIQGNKFDFTKLLKEV